MDETQDQIDALRGAYEEDESVKQVLSAFAKYQNSMKVVTVDVTWNRIGRSSLNRSQVVAVFKKFQELGFGTYTKGAHGHPSRFIFRPNKGPLWLAMLARGSEEEDLPDDTTTGASDEDALDSNAVTAPEGWISHVFRLREEGSVEILLPANLNLREAKRLGLWIRSIPLDGDGEEF